MPTAIDAIEHDALELPIDERARLVVQLLESIDKHTNADPTSVQAAWLAETNRRYQRYLTGNSEALAAEEVFADLRADDH